MAVLQRMRHHVTRISCCAIIRGVQQRGALPAHLDDKG